MNTGLKKILLLVVVLATLLSGCIGVGDPLDNEDREKIDQQIREAIEKTFPLPEQVTIQTHVGDDLRFTTNLSVKEVVAFYREAYTQKGYQESKDSQVSTENAALIFKKASEKDVALEVTKNDKGCDVHIQLKSSDQ